jgi:phosphatidylglycerol:prolipoprotein diacylglycerol transferase
MNETWFNPSFLTIGPVSFRWFGLFIVGGLFGTFFLTKKFLAKEKIELSDHGWSSLISYQLVGMLVGARLVYVLFYNSDFYSTHFSQILALWRGGYSFHGALAGSTLSLWIWCRKKDFFIFADCLALAGAPFIFLGKLGNFINGETYGRMTDSFLGIIIPLAGTVPRHPVQLYQAFFEGIVLFFLLLQVHRRKKFAGVTFGFFLLGEGLLRFVCEFFREPDPQLGFFVNFLTLGQVFSLMTFMIGVTLLYLARRSRLASLTS